MLGYLSPTRKVSQMYDRVEKNRTGGYTVEWILETGVVLWQRLTDKSWIFLGQPVLPIVKDEMFILNNYGTV